MIENPGETPDFAISASLNKDVPPAALVRGHWAVRIDPESICKSRHFSKGCHVSAAAVATETPPTASG